MVKPRWSEKNKTAAMRTKHRFQFKPLSSLRRTPSWHFVPTIDIWLELLRMPFKHIGRSGPMALPVYDCNAGTHLIVRELVVDFGNNIFGDDD